MVFAVWRSASELDGVGVLVIKGQAYLRSIIRDNHPLPPAFVPETYCIPSCICSVILRVVVRIAGRAAPMWTAKSAVERPQRIAISESISDRR